MFSVSTIQTGPASPCSIMAQPSFSSSYAGISAFLVATKVFETFVFFREDIDGGFSNTRLCYMFTSTNAFAAARRAASSTVF